MVLREFAQHVNERGSRLGITVPNEALAPLEIYVGLLAKWAQRINLTSLSLDPLSDEAVDRLLLEPIAAADHVRDGPLTWFDLGSGGGSPALPLKIMRPSASLVMVEPKGRKAVFLREAIRALALRDARVEPVRFQDLDTEQHGTAHLVTVRALRVDDALIETTEQLLRDGGELFLFGPIDGQTVESRELRRIKTVRLGNATGLSIIQRVPRGT